MEAPKVPASAFALFCSRRRLEVKAALVEKNASQQPQLGDIQKELSTLWKELSPYDKQRWTEEFETLKAQRLQWQQLHQPEGECTEEPRPSTTTEFPQARIMRIARLTPSLKKLSAEGARSLNLATAAALRQFTVRSLSGRKNDKTLTMDDVLSMISRGGVPLKFLQECKYAVSDEGGADVEEEPQDEGSSMKAEIIGKYKDAHTERRMQTGNVCTGRLLGERCALNAFLEKGCGENPENNSETA
ncbi:uncharacterized protein LOC113146499 [Cyclospora cayetanensis]|uniref:Uncharacterized protein LOC113146499 n=1 Tax=Cyclospora cayetanensis TaxID=88456 RepID=A0A6P6RQE8_9EIME|nr:uncharacterized protein LOC113146499 [Cyclospora cayetanensis]